MYAYLRIVSEPSTKCSTPHTHAHTRSPYTVTCTHALVVSKIAYRKLTTDDAALLAFISGECVFVLSLCTYMLDSNQKATSLIVRLVLCSSQQLYRTTVFFFSVCAPFFRPDSLHTSVEVRTQVTFIDEYTCTRTRVCYTRDDMSVCTCRRVRVRACANECELG